MVNNEERTGGTHPCAADEFNEGWLRKVLPVDGHPPVLYRMLAPAQHERSFYEAFGIRADDTLWLAPKNRVAIW